MEAISESVKEAMPNIRDDQQYAVAKAELDACEDSLTDVKGRISKAKAIINAPPVQNGVEKDWKSYHRASSEMSDLEAQLALLEAERNRLSEAFQRARKAAVEKVGREVHAQSRARTREAIEEMYAEAVRIRQGYSEFVGQASDALDGEVRLYVDPLPHIRQMEQSLAAWLRDRR